MKGSIEKQRIEDVFESKLIEIDSYLNSEDITDQKRKEYSRLYDEIFFLKKKLFSSKYDIKQTLKQYHVMNSLHEIQCEITNYIIKNKDEEDPKNLKQLEAIKQDIRKIMLKEE